MTATPAVTVIVPVHNVVDYLAECLLSIVSQTQPSLEIILVDDGSSDGSERICDEWAVRDQRIRVIHQAQQGSSVARNQGIDVSTGRYLTFVDADDVIGPKLVECLLKAVEATGAEVALGEITPFTDPGTPTFTDGTTVSLSPAEDELATIICVRPQWGPVAKLFRCDLFLNGPRFPAGLVHQDLAIMPMIFHRARTCARSDAILYGYRQRPGSISDSVRRLALSTDLIPILQGNIEFARGTEPHNSYERYLVTYLHHARKQIERLNTIEAWRRNARYVRAYRLLMRRYFREVVSARSAPIAQRLAFVASAISPHLYVTAFRAARRVRARTRSANSKPKTASRGE